MTTLDDLLSKAFDEIEESTKHKHVTREHKEIHPDATGCIYEIQSPILNTFDYCSSLEEAQMVAKSHYHEYSIWKIFVGSQKRICVQTFETRQYNNAMRAAFRKGFE
jgi:hypothetical protein